MSSVSTRSGVSAGWYCAIWERPHLRAAHVIDGQLVLLLRQRLELVLRDENQQVTRDDLLGTEPVHGDLTRLGEDGTVGSLIGRATIRRRCPASGR